MNYGFNERQAHVARIAELPSHILSGKLRTSQAVQANMAQSALYLLCAFFDDVRCISESQMTLARAAKKDAGFKPGDDVDTSLALDDTTILTHDVEGDTKA